MSEILSQEEVNALLQGVSDGSVATEGGDADAQAVRRCDLTSQERALYGRMPGLDRIFDTFVRSLRTSMEVLLGEIGGLSLSGIELLRYGSWMRRFPPPISVHMFRMTPLHGNGLVVISPSLAAAALEVAFGGKGRGQCLIQHRQYSGIEIRVLQRFVGRVLSDFHDAWEPIQDIGMSIVRSESNMAHTVVATEEAVVMVAELAVLMEATEGLGLSICVPYSALDPLRSKLSGEVEGITEGRGPNWGRQLLGRIDDVEVNVAVELGSTVVSLGRLLKLKVGDVVPLETRKDEPIVVQVERVPKFLGVPGLGRSGHAVRITGRLGRPQQRG
jgi:flagellar motor switch protein FliM